MDIRVVHVAEVTEVHAAGRLDGHWSEHLGGALDELIRQGRHRVRLNLAEVDYISSLGIRVLLTAYRQFQGVSGSFAVAEAVGNVARVLELAGLATLLMPAETTASTPPGPQRSLEHDGLRIDLYGESGAGMQGGAFGAPEQLRHGGYGPADCTPISIGGDTISVGLGAFGDDFAHCQSRFGEYLAVPGAAVAMPGDGTTTCDSMVAVGDFEPTLQALYGLRYEGSFTHQLRFEPADIDAPASGITLSALADAALRSAAVDAACVVLVGESAGLIGATLLGSPGLLASDVDPLTLPAARTWLSVTSEPVHARASVIAAGVIARPGVLPTCDEALLRAIGPAAGVLGHIHAAVYRFRPLQHGQLDLAGTLHPLIEHAPAETLMHLLGDDRDGGAPIESRLVRGACWIAPIIAAENSQ